VQRLTGHPAACESVYVCLNCGQGVYDGGIPRKAECGCGLTWLRGEDGYIQEVKDRVSISRLEDVFSVVAQVPSQPCPHLVSVTLGVFDASVPSSWKLGRNVDYRKLGTDLLEPWFLCRQRVLGLGDLFEIGDVRFKVMAALPNYGQVTQSTNLICYQSLGMAPIREIALGPLQPPNSIDSPTIHRYLHGYPRHFHLSNFHLDQYLYIHGYEFVVIQCEPNNGIPKSDTSLRLCSDTFHPAYTLELFPDPETLPAVQGVDLMEDFVLPFFQGWRRPLVPDLRFSIREVGFHVVNMSGNLHFVTEFTDIRLVERAVRLSIEDFLRRINRRERSGTNLPTRELDLLPTDPNARLCTICMEDFKLQETIKTLPCCKL